MSTKRIIIGVSGASGICLAESVLKTLKAIGGWESHLIVTSAARKTIACEYAPGLSYLQSLADVACDETDFSDPVASGTFRTEGMLIVPCSMKALAGIVSGYSENLLLRAADVVLKERRRLVIVPREAPLSTVHLKNLLALSELGGVIIPPVLSFYNHPQTMQDQIQHIAGKALDAFGIYDHNMKRWGEPQ